MKNFSLALLAIFVVLSTTLFAQQRNCASMDNLAYRQANDPGLLDRMEAIERFTNDFAQAPNNQRAVVTIPVVFHIVYRTNAENISTAQIMSQLEVLNDDFRRLNTDADNTWSQAADTEIQFCLATVDPNGNPTTGITRTSTSVNGFGTNDAVKFNSQGGKDAWPADKYMNFWVCNIGGGILGYAQFPGGNPATDGIVCGSTYTGSTGTATAPFNLGRTATHEVGHYLNLRHIWGDGNCNADDFVADTPTSDASNGGCAVGHVSCSSVDMVQNYMDYSDDACMNLFTQGQKTRMQAVFAPGGARFSLGNSTACGAAPTPTCNDGIQNGNETGVDCGGNTCPACPVTPTCNDGQQNGDETGVDCGGSSCPACPCNGSLVTVNILSDNYGSETTWTLKNSSGTTVASGGPYANNTSYSTSYCLPDGCYDFTINDSYGDGICCGYGNGSYSVTSGGATQASGGSFGSQEITNFCVGGSTAPTCNDGIQNGTETGVDCGGSCPACPVTPTCNDGIQNGTETGVDCGGTCPACPTGGGCDDIDYQTFESGWGIWNDGGSDVRRSSSDANYAIGTYCVRLRDNSGSASSMTTDNLALGSYNEVTIEFSYYARSMENGEDFAVDASTNGGSSWFSNIKNWTRGVDFNNNGRYDGTVTIVGTFTNTTKFRIRCDASGNSDWIYVDNVSISACSAARQDGSNVVYLPTTTPQPDNNLTDVFRETEEELSISDLNLFPNPTTGNLTVAFDMEEAAKLDFMIVDLTGKVVRQEVMSLDAGEQQVKVNGNDLAPGYYFVHLVNGKERVSGKFVIVR